MNMKSLQPKSMNLRGATTEELAVLTASGVTVVHGMSDMRQLRDAYDETDVASLIANSNIRVFKPD